ncbi:MAG TPA: hypothetical protein PL110_03985 [Candidatus Eremiobacteraeota bacterium]|nr:MAG: hypothetical protein BWY64_03331 [bacterium ADurb.Bin363]HPZ07247.1 hypothetical protein [Candidatus Eremiobacteraeota bacterium]
MKKLLYLSLILILILAGCQQGKNNVDVTSPSPAAVTTSVSSIQDTPVPEKTNTSVTMEKVETWTGGTGEGKYEMLLEEFPPKLNWDITIKDLSIDVFKDNSLKGEGKILISKKDLTEIVFPDEEKIAFAWDKTEYDFNFSGKKDGDKYIIDNFPSVEGLIKSSGTSLNTSEYKTPVFFVGKSIESTLSNDSLEFKHTESGPPPEGVTEIKGELLMKITKYRNR